MVSRTASSSGVVTRQTSVVAGSASRAPIVRSVSATGPRWARDDDQVVHASAEAACLEPCIQLLQDEELRQPGRCGGHHLEAGALEQATAQHAQGQGPVDERPERLLGLDGGGCQARPHGARLDLQPAGTEECAQPSGADLHRQHAAACPGGRARQRRRDGGLADAALAGDHDQPLRMERQMRAHGAS